MTTAPRVSIVIPTYNHAHFLGPALESVRAQTMADWECLVVNNHSTDDTEAVVAAFADPRIRLINFHNHGVIAASRNQGLRAACGEWVAFLDSDDLWHPAKLERCLEAGDNADVVSHPERFLKDGRIIHQTRVADPVRASFESLLLEGNCLSPSAILVRRERLLSLGGFSEDKDLVTAEDHDLWLRLARSGAVMAFVDAPLADFRIHGEQNSSSVERHMKASLAVLARHYPQLTPPAPWRYRRARAQVIYGAARTQQKLGRRGAALALLTRAFAVWPFLPKIPVAAALVLVGFWRN